MYNILIPKGSVAKTAKIAKEIVSEIVAEAMDFIHTERADPLVPKKMIRGVT